MESISLNKRTGKFIFWGTVCLLTVSLIIVSVRVYFKPYSHSVFPIYSFAVSNWQEGRSCYFSSHPERQMDVYRYSPFVTTALIPFHSLGPIFGGISWRLAGFVFFLCSLAVFFQVFLKSKWGRNEFGLFILATLPLALTNLNNGQLNLILTGIILLGASALALNRPALSGFIFALAFALKVYPVAIALLIGLAKPTRFFSSFLITTGFLFLFPFLFQKYEYVAGQYVEWITSLANDDRSQRPLADSFRDLWLLFRLMEAGITLEFYRWIQLASASIAGLLTFYSLGKIGFCKQWVSGSGALGTAWIIVFGPSTESSTFVIIAPWLAMSLFQIFRKENLRLKELAILATGLLIITLIAGIFPGARIVHSWGFHSLAGLFLLVFYTTNLLWLPKQNINEQRADYECLAA